MCTRRAERSPHLPVPALCSLAAYARAGGRFLSLSGVPHLEWDAHTTQPCDHAQRDREGRAALGVVLDPDAAAVALHNLMRNVESETQPHARPHLHIDAGHAVEALEQWRHLRLGDARPTIGNRHTHLVRRLLE